MRSPGPQRSFFALRWTSKQMNEGHHCAPRKYRAQKVCLKMHTDNSITVHLHVVLPTYFVESYLSLPVFFLISVQNPPIVLFRNRISLSLSLSALYLTFLPSSSSVLSSLPNPNMSVLLNKCPEVSNEGTLPLSVSSPSMSQLAWNHMNGLKIAPK